VGLIEGGGSLSYSKVAKQGDSLYIYDGSLQGFYTAIYDVFYSKKRPFLIVSEDNYQPTLNKEITVYTDIEKAQKVRQSIKEKISTYSLKLVETVFIGEYPNKEMIIYDYLFFGYQAGANTHNVLTEPVVSVALTAEKRILYDAHMYTGFVRFSDYDGVLIAKIDCKYFILPFIAPHFTDRFSEENFMIYDENFKAALVYKDKEFDIISVESLELPKESENELGYRQMWKNFYETIAIKERTNLKLRTNLMRKRFWKHMTEMQDEN